MTKDLSKLSRDVSNVECEEANYILSEYEVDLYDDLNKYQIAEIDLRTCISYLESVKSEEFTLENSDIDSLIQLIQASLEVVDVLS